MGVLRSVLHTRHLDPGSSLGEVLFGLIMTLTFTLGAGIIIEEEGAEGVRALLLATIGCNIAWGIIDGGLLILGRAFDRGRSARIRRLIRGMPEEQRAIAAVAAEMDEYVENITSPATRQQLYRHIVEQLRSSPELRTGVRGEDWLAALGGPGWR